MEKMRKRYCLLISFIIIIVYGNFPFRRIRIITLPKILLNWYREVGEKYHREFEHYSNNYWREHIENTQEMIINGAKEIRNRASALILGAGEIEPLEYLAQNFAQVVMYNLDYNSLVIASNKLPPQLKEKVRIEQLDITGIIASFINQAMRIVAESKTDFELEMRLSELMENFHFPQQNLLGEKKWDYIVVSLVLSQLMKLEFDYIEAKIKDKFELEDMTAFFLPSWQEKKMKFRQKVIDYLLTTLQSALKKGGRIYLADSILKIIVKQKVDGELVEVKRENMFLVESLTELLNNRFVIYHGPKKWTWMMKPALKPGEQGIYYQIEALIVGN